MPGLIVQVTGEGATYTLKKLEIKEDNVQISPFKNGENISLAEFQEVQKKLRTSFKEYFSID